MAETWEEHTNNPVVRGGVIYGWRGTVYEAAHEIVQMMVSACGKGEDPVRIVGDVRSRYRELPEVHDAVMAELLVQLARPDLTPEMRGLHPVAPR